jgi:hypothetical protein
MKMNWKNLKSNKCPKCNGYLIERHQIHSCTVQTCDFSIHHDKFDKIVSDLYRSKKTETTDEDRLKFEFDEGDSINEDHYD